MTLSPLPASKRKRRFAKPEETFEEMEAKELAQEQAEELQEEEATVDL